MEWPVATFLWMQRQDLVVLVKVELSTSTLLSQPSDQIAVDINEVYNISFYKCSDY